MATAKKKGIELPKKELKYKKVYVQLSPDQAFEIGTYLEKLAFLYIEEDIPEETYWKILKIKNTLFEKYRQSLL